MRIFSGPGEAPPGPGGGGGVWGHEHHRYGDPNSAFQGGLCGRFLHNLCGTIATCAYAICCCCLIQDCFRGPRDYYDYDPGPPPPPAPPSGLWGSSPPISGPTVYPAPPGPPGGPVQRPFY